MLAKILNTLHDFQVALVVLNFQRGMPQFEAEMLK